MSRPAWMARSRCADEYGPSFDRQPLGLQVLCCTQCPVRPDCLAYALTYETPGNPNLGKSGSVWGGTTIGQRRQLRRAARR